MGFLDRLRGRPTDAALIDAATTYATKRGAADGIVAIAAWARVLALGDGDLTRVKGREYAAALVAAIENDEPLPTAIPRPFAGTGAARREEIARASFAEIGQPFDAYSASDRLGMTNGLARSYEAGFEVSVHHVLETVANGTFESTFGRAFEPPRTTRSDEDTERNGNTEDGDRFQEDAHAAYGARIPELQALLRAHGLSTPADSLDEATWTREFKGQGGCLARLVQGPHGVVWCVEPKGHAGDHAGRCIPCDLARQTLNEMERRASIH